MEHAIDPMRCAIPMHRVARVSWSHRFPWSFLARGPYMLVVGGTQSSPAAHSRRRKNGRRQWGADDVLPPQGVPVAADFSMTPWRRME
jgi:hypothetical protein